MSFITTNYKDLGNNDYSPLPSAEYEMIIEAVREQVTKNGAESLQIDLVVREDLDNVPELKDSNAKFHKRHIFNDNWKRKATNQYDLDNFNYILDAAGVPEGTAINSIDDFIKVLTGKAVRVFVNLEDNEYKGVTTKVNRVAPWNYKKTKYPLTIDTDVPTINDEDLPF